MKARGPVIAKKKKKEALMLEFIMRHACQPEGIGFFSLLAKVRGAEATVKNFRVFSLNVSKGRNNVRD